MNKLKGIMARRHVRSLAYALLAIFVAAMTFLPFYWAISLSIRNPVEAFTVTGLAVPFVQYKPTLSNWKTELAIGETQRALLNRTVIAVCAAFLAVVIGTPAAYAIGRFDGKVFTTESGKHPFNFGNCFYASQTFNDIPREDGRRIQIAWGQIGHPEMPFNQMMNFPVELTLRTTEEGVRLFAEPVREIELLHGKKHAWFDETLRESENLLKEISGDLFHIRAEFQVGKAREFGFKIRGISVAYDVKGEKLACRGKTATLKPAAGRVHLEILVDRTSIEIFANRGRIYMPIGIIPPDDDRSLKVFTVGDESRINSLEVWELRSAWAN